MSILLKPSINPDRAPMTTLIMALAVFRALEKQSAPAGVRFGIKWPNDGVVSVDDGKTYKKIVGILTEMRLEEREIKDITIGTGLNINISAVPPEVRDTAATIADALGRPLCRAALVADIWNCFEEDYEKFLAAGSLKPLKADYERGLVNAGRRVRVLDPKGEYEGTALGISDTGELLVRTADDKIIPVSSGEISVRGVMGYV
jgi:BirA family biotin operon repressor/biotin-[acetyl-CoA-carboxylase] ligase